MIHRHMFQRVSAWCGREPPVPAYADAGFRVEDQSPDERDLVALLGGMRRPWTAVLHVGVGSSELARRHAPHVARIDGITVVAAEVERAEALALPNYRVRRLDKHGPEMTTQPGPYDLIVDNNLSTYACCRRHFDRMMAGYASLLAEGGLLLTHRRGLAWRGPGFRMGWRDLVREGERHGLGAVRFGADVWGLRWTGPVAPPAPRR